MLILLSEILNDFEIDISGLSKKKLNLEKKTPRREDDW